MGKMCLMEDNSIMEFACGGDHTDLSHELPGSIGDPSETLSPNSHMATSNLSQATKPIDSTEEISSKENFLRHLGFRACILGFRV